MVRIHVENMDSDFEIILVENAKLKASLKAANYEKEKLLELVKNLLSNMTVYPDFNEEAYVREDKNNLAKKDSIDCPDFNEEAYVREYKNYSPKKDSNKNIYR